jgi:uncharacterized membrane protein YhaH (DUF805 family)
MSDQQPTRPSGQSHRRNPWVTALLILIGIILLLPGLCSLIFGAILISSGGPGDNSEFLPLLLFCFMVGVGWVALIVFAIRR